MAGETADKKGMRFSSITEEKQQFAKQSMRARESARARVRVRARERESARARERESERARERENDPTEREREDLTALYTFLSVR